MSRFLRSIGGMLGSTFVLARENYAICAQNAFSTDLWGYFGQDAWWTRTHFRGGMQSGGFVLNGDNINSDTFVWDWSPHFQYEAKGGQSRNTITGVTRDSTGAALGGCTVRCFDLITNAEVDMVVSDANGNFTVSTPFTGNQVYLECFLAGSPDVFGASDNLTPT